MFYKGDEVLSAGALGRLGCLVHMIHLRSSTNARVTPWQLRRPRTFRARGFGSQRHGSADKRHQLKQWMPVMRVESCSFAASFEESWPNPADAPEEAGT